MRKASVGCAFLALGLGIATPASAAAPTITRVTMKGQSAFASAEHHDTCVDVFFSISAADETVVDSSGTNAQRSAFVGFGGRDLCNFLSFGGSALIPLSVPLNTVSVTLPFDLLIDYANTETDERTQRRLVGTVTIVGNGDFEKVRESRTTYNDGTKTVSKQRGTTREADVTVQATLDGAPITFEEGSGSLGTIKQGTVEVTRN